MEVLKEGKPYCWESRQTCTGGGNSGHGCGAELLVKEEDLFVTTSGGGYGWGLDYYITFKCPCCGALTDIPEYGMDRAVRSRVISEYRNRKK